MKSVVSIVIPCHNDYLYIEQAVQSAINQTYSNKEIILVDDGSNKKTKKVITKLRPKLDVLITQENQGVVVARNKAIALAKGDYILTLDSDDYFEPTFIEKAVKILDNCPHFGMVTSWLSIWTEEAVKLRVDKPSGENGFHTMFSNNAPASLLFRKECWESVGGYDLNLKKGYEDWEFNIAVGAKGWKVYVIPEALFNYRKRVFSRSKQAKNYYSEIRLYTYIKHQDLLRSNMEETIGYFIRELEFKTEQIEKLRSSSSYKFWNRFIRPWKKFFKNI